jgi:hypothetical protein
MPNHPPTTNATASAGGPASSKAIADGNEDQERLARTEMIANSYGDQERLTRADEPFAHWSDARSPRGIA